MNCDGNAFQFRRGYADEELWQMEEGKSIERDNNHHFLRPGLELLEISGVKYCMTCVLIMSKLEWVTWVNPNSCVSGGQWLR